MDMARGSLLFDQMQEVGPKPNNIAFVYVMSVCGTIELVDEGHRLFDSIDRYYGVKLTMESGVCMVDLLGGAWKLNGIENLINKILFELNSLV